MRYLVTITDNEPFLTEWFNTENHFAETMVVYDLAKGLYTTDGVTWEEIKEDHL